jgi:K+-sensing histidine kinase KdpD
MVLISYLLVVVIGYIDYLTGDYSILVFYIIPVSLAAWFQGRSGAVFISLAAGVARLVSDYYSYSAATFKYWNSFQDMVFLLIMGILIALLKKQLSVEQ